ncbi:hypothetical protein M153_8590003450 [Pseudoloma neurophilia]|uniref:Uncharacterized protein n=1 Tax=Pseudoloma neurophilia TaxID=146866 RepID=A0A0R0LVQ2_9MICR|nr:hypothetical protein M153_8590003450 [Pseudoloma neurophilia]
MFMIFLQLTSVFTTESLNSPENPMANIKILINEEDKISIEGVNNEFLDLDNFDGLEIYEKQLLSAIRNKIPESQETGTVFIRLQAQKLNNSGKECESNRYMDDLEKTITVIYDRNNLYIFDAEFYNDKLEEAIRSTKSLPVNIMKKSKFSYVIPRSE